jgi:hypothetical protein
VPYAVPSTGRVPEPEDNRHTGRVPIVWAVGFAGLQREVGTAWG